MPLKKKIQLTIRITDNGKVVDSFTAKAFLNNSLTKKASENINTKEDLTQEDLKGTYQTIEDVISSGTLVNDLSLRSKINAVLGGCEIKAKVLGFQANSSVTLTIGSEQADVNDNEYIQTILTGN